MGVAHECSSDRDPPEQSFQVLGQLCAPRVARVHGDEQPNRWHQGDDLPKEVECFLLGTDCILNTFDLPGEQRCWCWQFPAPCPVLWPALTDPQGEDWFGCARNNIEI